MFGIPENWLAALVVLLVGGPLAYFAPQLAALVGSKLPKGKQEPATDSDNEPDVWFDSATLQVLDDDALDAEAAKRLQARYAKRGPKAREAMQQALQHHFDPIEDTDAGTPVDPQIAAQVNQVLASRLASQE